LGGFLALPIANPNTAGRTASSLSYACTATADNSTRWSVPSSRRLRGFTTPASRNTRRRVSKVLFLSEGERGYRTCLLNPFEAQAGTGTGLPRRTSLFVWPLLPMAWPRTGSDVPLKIITYPATPALPGELPTSGEPWRSRGDGLSDRNRCFRSRCRSPGCIGPQSKFGSPSADSSSRRGSGSRRHTRWASMYRRQRTNQKKRS